MASTAAGNDYGEFGLKDGSESLVGWRVNFIYQQR